MATTKKILLVHLYSNGDCLYATAIARQIKSDFPNYHLTWAIARFCKSIILENPFVDAILEVDNVKKNDVGALRKFRRECAAMKTNGQFDEVFFTHNGDTNQAYYDGCIRSSILRAYPRSITVPVTPVLKLKEEEIQKAAEFAVIHQLKEYQYVILFEYAPQSGQSTITKELAIQIAEGITADSNTAVILSSANKIAHASKAIIDGSSLTIRETAALTHHCSFLLGTSSGITWLSVSDAGKLLPMVQLFTPFTRFENPISRDFERFGLPVDKVIELLDLDKAKIIACVKSALENFDIARKEYNCPIPIHFKTSRNIVYNLLCYLEFGAIVKHIKINREVYGDRFLFYKEIATGVLEFPFKLVSNVIKKQLLSKYNC